MSGSGRSSFVNRSSSRLAIYFFLSCRWVRADPATLFPGFEVFGFESCFDALVPTGLDVFSFRAIWGSSLYRV
jgi:hypothetical protein